MRQITDAELDELIRQALIEEAESIEITPEQVEAGWQKLQARLEAEGFCQKELRRKVLMPWGQVAKIAGLVLLVITVAFNSLPYQAKAVGNRFFTSIWQKVTGNSVNVFISGGLPEEAPAKDAPPPPKVFEVAEPEPEKEMSLEEIKQTATFRPFVPAYLPDGYVLKRATYQVIYKESSRVYLEYDGGVDVPLRIEQRNILGQMGAGVGFDKDDAEAKQIQINGNPALLIVFKRGHAGLMWMQNSIQIDISGQISAGEIVKIAESMRQ
jgi:hypothetical protein